MKEKDGIISVWVTKEIKTAKKKLGTNWRALIIRGIKQATNNDNNNETNEKITRMATKIQEQATRIYNLETKTQVR